MLLWVRKLLSNWVARILIALLVVGFVFWGVSNVLTLVGSNSAVAMVGGVPIDLSAVQASYQNALSQASRQGQPGPAERRQIAQAALGAALRREIIRQEAQHLGVAVPDSAIRKLLDAQPQFQTNGAFDKAKFTSILQQNNLSPDLYLDRLRGEMAAQQIIQPLLRGAAAPPSLVDRLFTYVAEQRTAQTVEISAAAQPSPAAPSIAVLLRYWRNHQAEFTAPQFRRVKIVILSPALLAPHEQVDPADIDAGVASAAARAPSIAQRSVQVISVGNLASSSQLEAAWKRGASWDKMQAMAKRFGASAVALNDAQQVQIPSADLAKAVFAAPVGEVVGPVAGALGMYVFKVTSAGQSGPDQAALRAKVTAQLQLQKAQAEVAQNVDALQDALAGQTPLDQLPGNLGLVAVEGTMDAAGDTPQGKPAPIPGGDALKAAIVKSVFAAQEGDPAQLINGPDGSYYALSVEKIDPPAVRPFVQVRAQVAADWMAAAMSREAEVKAADLMHAVQQGRSLAAAAKADGLTVNTVSGLVRNPAEDTEAQKLSALMFTLKPGQASMLQTDKGFTVAVLTGIDVPKPADDPADVAQLRQEMTKALQNDLGESFLAGLQARDHVRVNQQMLAQIYQ